MLKTTASTTPPLTYESIGSHASSVPQASSVTVIDITAEELAQGGVGFDVLFKVPSGVGDG